MTYAQIQQWVATCDRVLITAGAGLSAAAGYDYTDQTRFAELFPAMHRLGVRARYQLIGAVLPPPLMWGYWATHVQDIRFSPGPHPIYQRLRELVGDRDHFVLTSNVDALFARNGFDRVATPQGDYGRYQCESPCTRETWPSKPVIDTALAAYNPSTGTVTSPAAIPRCPRCGGEVFLNVHKGPEYIADPYQPTMTALQDWLATEGRLLVLDIGTGFNTPGVIRRPAERAALAHPDARLIRINRDHPAVPPTLTGRSLSIAADANEVLLP
jgi:NAD-dependent SIR2 family protein deacetylase